MTMIFPRTNFFFFKMKTSQKPRFPLRLLWSVRLNKTDDSECLAEFRFHNNEVPVLLEALQLPQSFKCHQGTICDGLEALCITPRRFAYPYRYSDLIPRFGRPVPELSMISNFVIDTFYQGHNYRITQWNNTLLNPPLLENYARAINLKEVHYLIFSVALKSLCTLQDQL